ncbi:hypothetical protein [Sphingosinicella sp.]|uniref:hypothetical protein n=1 Tax=Sphingosinicella sp. TaxID=1917971 RepID=UPI002619A891|nr:hypothetical protein [Sphingosinicella sp.]MEA3538695.1 hypothetical protein [Pseudomonadota bacterium]
MSDRRACALIGLFALCGGAASAQLLEGVYVLPEAFEIGLTLSKVRMPAGTILKKVDSDSKLKVCSESVTVFQLGIPYSRACLFDDDGDGSFDRVAGSSLAGSKMLKTPVPYRAVEVSSGTVQDAKTP